MGLADAGERDRHTRTEKETERGRECVCRCPRPATGIGLFASCLFVRPQPGRLTDITSLSYLAAPKCSNRLRWAREKRKRLFKIGWDTEHFIFSYTTRGDGGGDEACMVARQQVQVKNGFSSSIEVATNLQQQQLLSQGYGHQPVYYFRRALSFPSFFPGTARHHLPRRRNRQQDCCAGHTPGRPGPHNIMALNSDSPRVSTGERVERCGRCVEDSSTSLSNEATPPTLLPPLRHSERGMSKI